MHLIPIEVVEKTKESAMLKDWHRGFLFCIMLWSGQLRRQFISLFYKP